MALNLVGIVSAVASMWAVTKFLHSSFIVYVSDTSRRVSNLYLAIMFNANIFINKRGLVITCGFDSLLLVFV